MIPFLSRPISAPAAALPSRIQHQQSVRIILWLCSTGKIASILSSTSSEYSSRKQRPLRHSPDRRGSQARPEPALAENEDEDVLDPALQTAPRCESYKRTNAKTPVSQGHVQPDLTFLEQSERGGGPMLCVQKSVFGGRVEIYNEKEQRIQERERLYVYRAAEERVGRRKRRRSMRPAPSSPRRERRDVIGEGVGSSC